MQKAPKPAKATEGVEVSKFIWRQGKVQSYHPSINYCHDCNKELIGHGVYRVDRRKVTAANPFGEIVCQNCAKDRGLRIFIPSYKYHCNRGGLCSRE